MSDCQPWCDTFQSLVILCICFNLVFVCFIIVSLCFCIVFSTVSVFQYDVQCNLCVFQYGVQYSLCVSEMCSEWPLCVSVWYAVFPLYVSVWCSVWPSWHSWPRISGVELGTRQMTWYWASTWGISTSPSHTARSSTRYMQLCIGSLSYFLS